MGAAGEVSGAEPTRKTIYNQEGPRHTQDGGENTPSIWGNTEQFAPQVSKGEGISQSSVKCDWSVNISSGAIMPLIEKVY